MVDSVGVKADITYKERVKSYGKTEIIVYLELSITKNSIGK